MALTPLLATAMGTPAAAAAFTMLITGMISLGEACTSSAITLTYGPASRLPQL